MIFSPSDMDFIFFYFRHKFNLKTDKEFWELKKVSSEYFAKEINRLKKAKIKARRPKHILVLKKSPSGMPQDNTREIYKLIEPGKRITFWSKDTK